MSLWDNVKKFAQSYADDDYDDYGEDDDYLDDYEEPEKPAPARRKPRRAPAPADSVAHPVPGFRPMPAPNAQASTSRSSEWCNTPGLPCAQG